MVNESYAVIKATERLLGNYCESEIVWFDEIACGDDRHDLYLVMPQSIEDEFPSRSESEDEQLFSELQPRFEKVMFKYFDKFEDNFDLDPVGSIHLGILDIRLVNDHRAICRVHWHSRHLG